MPTVTVLLLGAKGMESRLWLARLRGKLPKRHPHNRV
jgi:hypothetical protein